MERLTQFRPDCKTVFSFVFYKYSNVFLIFRPNSDWLLFKFHILFYTNNESNTLKYQKYIN